MTTNKMMSILLIKLKVLAIAMLIAMVALFSFSFKTSERLADDIWKQLGMTQAQGAEGVKESFIGGYLSYYNAKNAKNIATGNRAAVAKDLLNYTKQYINGPVFKKEYDKMRIDAKPTPSEKKAKTKEEVRKEQIADTEKTLKEYKESSKKSADMAKIFKPSIEMMEKNLADYKDPNSKMIEMFYQNELREQQDRERSFKEAYARWEKEWPEDFRQKIKQRLQKYLDLAATVDFTAELKPAGKKMKFVNPAYEGKAYDWKQIYRAGKDVYDLTKAFAEQWMKELK